MAATLALAAEDLRPVPPIRGPVNDEASMIGDRAAVIAEELTSFRRRTGIELVVLTVPTTAPETIEQFGIRVSEAWQLGRGKIDDGALLIVARDDRAARIEVGRGLEGDLTDLVAHRILDEELAPRFRTGNYGDGVLETVRRIMHTLAHTGTPPGKSPSHESSFPLGVLLIVIVIGEVLALIFGRLAGATVAGGIAFVGGTIFSSFFSAVLIAVICWFAVLVGAMQMLSGPGYGGRYRRFPGGYGAPSGGWSGGIGGGMTWGGGGGTFGGGGASGRW